MDKPVVMLMSAGNYAMLEATIKFSGRDRRRVKREQNKAFKKARVAAVAPSQAFSWLNAESRADKIDSRQVLACNALFQNLKANNQGA